jgi:hypothetical protein
VLEFASFSDSGKSRLFRLDVLVPVHRVQRADEPTRTAYLLITSVPLRSPPSTAKSERCPKLANFVISERAISPSGTVRCRPGWHQRWHQAAQQALEEAWLLPSMYLGSPAVPAFVRRRA